MAFDLYLTEKSYFIRNVFFTVFFRVFWNHRGILGVAKSEGKVFWGYFLGLKILVEHHLTLLDTTCRMRLSTLLVDDGRVWLAQSSLPTSLVQHCWMMLEPFERVFTGLQTELEITSDHSPVTCQSCRIFFLIFTGLILVEQVEE